jgi:exonuclease III
MKIISFNVNGIRAIAGKSFIPDMQSLAIDVICLQETKASVEQVKETVAPLNMPFVYANEATKKDIPALQFYQKQNRYLSFMTWVSKHTTTKEESLQQSLMHFFW